jgi:hypothetical protein
MPKTLSLILQQNIQALHLIATSPMHLLKLPQESMQRPINPTTLHSRLWIHQAHIDAIRARQRTIHKGN